MKKLLAVVIAAVVVSTLSGCTSDTRSMWHSKYAFKSVGQVMAMCDDGDRDACYAARDMGAMQVGLNQANGVMMQQQALQAQQEAANAQAHAAALQAMPKTVTCRPGFGDSVTCTGF